MMVRTPGQMLLPMSAKAPGPLPPIVSIALCEDESWETSFLTGCFARLALYKHFDDNKNEKFQRSPARVAAATFCYRARSNY